MARLGVTLAPHLSARHPQFSPCFHGCLPLDWEFRDVITGLKHQARSCQPGEKQGSFGVLPARLKQTGLSALSAWECWCSQRNDGAGIPHPTLSHLGRAALAVPDSSVIDEGNNARLENPAWGKPCPSPGISLPWEAPRWGLWQCPVDRSGLRHLEEKVSLRKKAGSLFTSSSIFFFFVCVFQHESLPFSYSTPKKKNLHAIILLS